jgi:hypothetical protein
VVASYRNSRALTHEQIVVGLRIILHRQFARTQQPGTITHLIESVSGQPAILVQLDGHNKPVYLDLSEWGVEPKQHGHSVAWEFDQIIEAAPELAKSA